jgi:hypothetical protein
MNTRKQLEQHSNPSSQQKPRTNLWFCLSERCAPKEWLVRQDTYYSDSWTIAENTTSTPYNIAADMPICPHCGDKLHLALEEKSHLP